MQAPASLLMETKSRTQSPYRNNPHMANGKESIPTYVFYSSVNLETGKTIASVTLPTTVTGGQLHVFAITTK